MKVRLILLLVCILLSLAISADRSVTICPQAWSPRSDSQTLDEGLGVNIHFTDPQPGEMKMIADAGFRWVRMDFKWDVTERERGSYDFSAYDRLTQSLDQFKLRALFILDYGNPLYDNGAPPRTETARKAFARWATAAAKNFSGRGVIWELYNEPNIKQFWPPTPNVNEYIALALEAGRAFRASVPSEKLIGPATSGIDFEFIEACCKAGLLDYWFAVSVHPYRQTNPETVANDYCRLREMISRYSARQIPIFASEWGFSSAWPRMDETKQSALVARELLTNVANGVSLSIWYDWRDDGTNPTEPEHHFGLVRNAYQPNGDQVYQPKPAYRTVKALNEIFTGFRFEKRLAVGSADDYVLAFINGSERRIAAWTTSAAAHRFIIPFGAGQFLVTSHTGENLPPIPTTEQSLTIEVSSALAYITKVNKSGS